VKLKVIACNVVFREVCHWAARSPHIVDVRFLDRTLHNEPDDLRAAIQAEVDQADGYDAVALGYGLCSNGAAYLRARQTPIVVPRAHDCITLFLGSRSRYDESFSASPGTYYYTSGWIERAGARLERTTPEGQATYDRTYQDYVARFGEESARYLMETLHTWWKSYTRAAFIRMDLPEAATYEEPAREQTQEVAREYGWAYEDLQGDQRIFARLLRGDWGLDEFLLVPAGHQVVPSYDEGVLGATTDYQPIPPRASRV